MQTRSDGDDMCLDKVLTDFGQKLVVPLFEDIRRTLEVTCYKEGDENHGSNFLGNAVVLSGIETVAQFIDPYTEEQHKAFKKRAKELYKGIRDKDTRKHVEAKRAPSQGSHLAKHFMKGYFASVFRKNEFGVPIYKLIWEFRNAHMHAFYPFYQKVFGVDKEEGGFRWGLLAVQKRG